MSFQVTKSMDGVVKGLDKAMQSMDLEKVTSFKSCGIINDRITS